MSKLKKGINDLATLYPELAKEWSDKNELSPSDITPGCSLKVLWKCSTCGYEWPMKVNVRVAGHGCWSCRGKFATETNNFAVDHPELLCEWDYEKNGDLKPENFKSLSNKKVWWKCSKCGHEWQTIIANRSRGYGCHACAGRVATKENNLALTHPEISEDWNYEKNNGLTPFDVKAGSHKNINWKCHKCGHEWNTRVYSRKEGCGCPACSGRVATEDNNITITHPKIAKEFDKKKNKGIDVKSLKAGSHKNISWKCSICGHEWETKVYYRTHGTGKCPNYKNHEKKENKKKKEKKAKKNKDKKT